MTNEARARAALKALIKEAGGPRRLAESLDVKRQAVEAWDLIPIKYLRDTHRLYGKGLNELRPDVAELGRLK